MNAEALPAFEFELNIEFSKEMSITLELSVAYLLVKNSSQID